MQEDTARILIVDDDETITWTITTALRRVNSGFQIYQAHSGLEAYGYIKQLKSLDLLITDVHMPQLTGVELLEKLKELDSTPGIIVITGFGTDDIYRQVERLGAVRYFTKPFDVQLLVKAAIEILKHRRERSQHPGFSGSFGSLRMVDVIQINSLLHQTGLLSVKAHEHQGKVYFNDGQIIHAWTRNCTGEDALYEIIDWGYGEFQFREQVAPHEASISKTWEFLLIEHSRRIDMFNR